MTRRARDNNRTVARQMESRWRGNVEKVRKIRMSPAARRAQAVDRTDRRRP